MNKFPSSMATQHPDNSEKYIPIQDEPLEGLKILESKEKGGFGIDELMVDFEGKLTPYHQTSQIALGLVSNNIIPGVDVKITPRIPNAVKEPVFRQLMSIMSLVETNILVYKKTNKQAITETIIPMIEKGEELINIQNRINSVIELGNKNYDIHFPEDSIKIIPLIETVPAIIKADEIINEYHKNQQKKGIENKDYRVMLARSDSAMSYGMLSSVLSIRIALSKLRRWSLANNVEIGPILGCGSLPFRGHLTKDNLTNIYNTYKGVRTFTIQSGLRYDHGENEAKEVVNDIKDNVWKYDADIFSSAEIEKIQEYIGIFTKHYLNLFNKLIDTIDFVAKKIPKNRDRLASSKTDLQYVREFIDVKEISALVKNEKLKKEIDSIKNTLECSIPRAISFTASLYTIGMPPEFIGVGQGVKEIKERFGDEGIKELIRFYPSLKSDLEFASQYVNMKVSKGIVSDESHKLYEESFKEACEIFGIKVERDEVLETKLYHTILMSGRPILLHLIGKEEDLFDDIEEEEKVLKNWIVKTGKLRGSLG